MDATRRRVLELAEQGDWDDVLELVARDPVLAQSQDDFGMLPLHWACTEPSVQLETIKTLLDVFPEACQLENLSGMAPLHVAIASKMTGLAINALLQTYPEAAFMKDGAGRYPIELALDNHLPKFTVDLIRKAGARAVKRSSSAPVVMKSTTTGTAALGHSVSFESLADSDGADNNNSDADVEASHSPADLAKARSLGSLMATRQASEYARLLDASPPTSTASTLSSTSSSTSSMTSSTSSIGPIESTTIALHLKELLTQLQQLRVDLRSNNSHASSSSTVRSSFSCSSSSSSGSHRVSDSDVNPTKASQTQTTVLWNPNDKLGFTLEAATASDTGARIHKFASRSSVLGVEALSVGDVLVRINGTSVAQSSFVSITRFLKHAKVTCKLGFAKPGGSSNNSAAVAPARSGYMRSASHEGSSAPSTYSTKSGASLHRMRSNDSVVRSAHTTTTNQQQQSPPQSQSAHLQLPTDPIADDQNTAALYAKVAELLDTTLKKVTAVEETVRLSSAMSFCT